MFGVRAGTAVDMDQRVGGNMALIFCRAVEALKNGFKRYVMPPRPVATVTYMKSMEWLRRSKGKSK